MIMLGHSSIDDDDEELGDDDAQGLKRRGPRWSRSNSMLAPKCLVLVHFCGTARVLLVAVPRGPQLGWSYDDF